MAGNKSTPKKAKIPIILSSSNGDDLRFGPDGINKIDPTLSIIIAVIVAAEIHPIQEEEIHIINLSCCWRVKIFSK